MLGLIIWAILIFFIACAINPEFPVALLISLVAAGGALFIKESISIWIESRSHRKKQAIRDEAMAEWEKKWGRPHPERSKGNQRFNDIHRWGNGRPEA